MELIYQKYTDEAFDEKGTLSKISFKNYEHFNFGFDVVDALAEKCPDKVAMYWLSDDMQEERKFTFRDISRYSNKAANYFRSLGIGKGDVVMLVLKRHYQFWYAIVALHKIGAIVVPATVQLMKKDFVYRFQKAKVKAIICTGENDAAAEADKARGECPTVEVWSMAKGHREGWLDFDAGVEAASDVFERPQGEEATCADDLMLMYFTSGTSGYPKIAAHSFSYPLGHVVTARHWHNVDPNGIHLTIADTGWGKAVWGKLYGQWLCEACVFVYDFEKFNADNVLSCIGKYGITTFCAPPTIYRFFIKEDLSKYDLSSLQYATTAGEAVNPEVFKQFYEATGLKLMEGFGQTETTLTIANLVGTEPRPGSMGKPNPQYNIDVITPDGQTANPGETGEIIVRCENRKQIGLFFGYYLDEQKTEEAWEGGVYHTGDTAWRDEDGYFWYVGRTDDLIKSSGYRIGPFEIENVLMEHPSVMECAVTGAPDPVRGQVIKATIVLAPGYTASDALKKEIQNYVKKMTAPYKYPRIIEFVAELPKTISGKIRRVELREQDQK